MTVVGVPGARIRDPKGQCTPEAHVAAADTGISYQVSTDLERRGKCSSGLWGSRVQGRLALPNQKWEVVLSGPRDRARWCSVALLGLFPLPRGPFLSVFT